MRFKKKFAAKIKTSDKLTENQYKADGSYPGHFLRKPNAFSLKKLEVRNVCLFIYHAFQNIFRERKKFDVTSLKSI
jgi:hypothetical protein